MTSRRRPCIARHGSQYLSYSQHVAHGNLPRKLVLSYQFELRPDLRVLPFDWVSLQIGESSTKREARCKKLSWHLTLSSPSRVPLVCEYQIGRKPSRPPMRLNARWLQLFQSSLGVRCLIPPEPKAPRLLTPQQSSAVLHLAATWEFPLAWMRWYAKSQCRFHGTLHL